MRFVALLILVGISSGYLATTPTTGGMLASASPRFPDFGFLPPPNQYVGRVFRLNQDYPAQKPADNAIPAVCTGDFERVKKNWKQYLADVRDYCFKDNILGGDVEDDFRMSGSQAQRWFHMPWQHYGPFGREGIHGLTKEARVRPQQLAPSQNYADGQTYAIGFYNEFGGTTIGQVWKDREHPGEHGKVVFPVGTVIFKLLFVDVPVDQVPSLNPPLKWQAYITDTFKSTNRSIRDVALIQMDIMVRHENAPTGWIFGTFQYNGQRKGADRQNLWNNLVPVGLQWGNDPDVKDDTSNPRPSRTIINDKLKETVINTDTDQLPPTHLGWGGRLNGPVDNPMSACMSCHMTAETPQYSQMSPYFLDNPPPAGSNEWMRWFQNPGCTEPFDKEGATTDFSLQMAISLQNFRKWRDEGVRISAEEYKSRNVPAHLKDFGPRDPRSRREAKQEVEIRRDVPLRDER